MDRALQERIIGALVLVVIVVLVVPVFLDGPSDDTATVSQSVTLPGQNGQETKQQTIVLERDRAEPVPANGSGNSAAIAEKKDPIQVVEREVDDKPAETKLARQTPDSNKAAETTEIAPKVADEPVATTPPESSQKASTKPAASSESTTGMWAVQLGSFSNQANAEKLAADLRKGGYAAFLSQLKTSSGQLQRVRIGPQKDRKSAEAVAARLLAAGHKGQVVPHP